MHSLNVIQSDTKRALLMLMKRVGVVSLDEAEKATKLSRTNLREHFLQLERDGLVNKSSSRAGRGRPSLRYSLTAEASGLFPLHDGTLLGSLLSWLETNGNSKLIADFFEDFWDNRYKEVADRLKDVEADDRAGRVAVIRSVLEAQGFMPEIRELDGGLELRECNCPFPEAVKHTRLPCRLEAQFLAKVFGQPVGRVSYIPDGSAACSYEFATDATTDVTTDTAAGARPTPL